MPSKPLGHYTEYKARLAHQEADRKWREEAASALTDALRSQPGRLASLLMLVLSGQIHRQMTDKQLTKAKEAIKQTVKPTWQSLLQLEGRALGCNQFDLSQIIGLNSSELIAQAIAESYSIPLPAFPRLEDFMPAAKDSPT